jgi:hypothetical protein
LVVAPGAWPAEPARGGVVGPRGLLGRFEGASHTRAFRAGSRISAAYRPHGRFRTPRSLGCSAARSSPPLLPVVFTGGDIVQPFGAMDRLV